MAAKTFLRSITLVLILTLLFIAGCKSGGDDLVDENGIRPSISGLSTNSANIGDQVVITGNNFGLTMGESTVTLNGMTFAVIAWDDTEITVAVASGMSSGIVIVTVGGLPSQSGQEAQLFIPTAPVSGPVINGIAPDYGEAGIDQVVITGMNFGAEQGGSGVFFPREGGAVSQTEVVQAEVVVIDVEGTPVPQWSNSSIKVTVPLEAASGQVYVVVDAEQSNSKPFTVYKSDITGPPDIDSITPNSGPVATVVTIAGTNFGHSQGSSSAMIGAFSLDILSWANEEIIGRIPIGATTGPIRVSARGEFVDSEPFTVATAPEITGVSPSDLRIGNPVTVFGSNFGIEKGNGTLRIGSTNVTTTHWDDVRIEVASLPSISFNDKDSIPLTVTADNTLSDTTTVRLISDLDVFVDATPSTGEAGSTVFNFFVTVTGGSGSYEYTLYPDAGNPLVTSVSSVVPIPYTYTPVQVPTETTFQTQVRVEDTVSGDIAVAPGPEIFVVAQGQAVITAIEVLDFNYPLASSPRIEAPYCFVFDSLGSGEIYHDFTFDGDDIFFASGLSDKDGLPGFTRDLKSFMTGSASAKPYGYRYNSGDGKGSFVRIVGINFGEVEGAVYLNADGPKLQVPSADIVGPDLTPGWSDTAIDFRLPSGIGSDLSGTVVVTVDGEEITSHQRLICSPSLNPAQPNPVMLNGTLALTGFDLLPPVVNGMTGPDSYLIWIVQATWNDPFGGGGGPGPALYSEPIPVNPVGSTINFNMSNLTSGSLIEVFSPFGDQSALVTANSLEAGSYQVFLWTGVLDEGDPIDIANSGIFSEAIPVNVTAGGGGHNVSGTVTDKDPPNDGVPGVSLTLTPGGFSATTNAGGAYTIVNVPDGNYTLTPTGAGGDFDPATRDVTVGGADVGGQDFQVTAGGGPGPDATVTGRAYDGDSGAGIDAVTIRFWHDPTPNVTTDTAPDGTYSIVVPEWDYFITATKVNWAFAVDPPHSSPLIVAGDMNGVDFRGQPAGGG